MSDEKIIDLPPLPVQDLTDISETSKNGTGSYKETRQQALDFMKSNIAVSPYQVGDLIYADTTGTLNKISPISAGNVLQSIGIGVAPAYGKVDLATTVSGVLPSGNGGTGESTYVDGQLLIGNTVGNTLEKSTLTAGPGINIDNGNGSITISTSADLTVIYVNSNSGVDAAGYGSAVAPYATISYAISQISDNSESKPYLINAFGVFTDTDWKVRPWIFYDFNEGRFEVTDQVTLDPSWSSGGVFSLKNVDNLSLTGGLEFDFDSIGAPFSIIQIDNVKVGVASLYNIIGNAAGSTISLTNMFLGLTAQHDMRVENCFGGLTLTSPNTIDIVHTSETAGGFFVLNNCLAVSSISITDSTAAGFALVSRGLVSFGDANIVSTGAGNLSVNAAGNTILGSVTVDGANAFLVADVLSNTPIYLNGATSANLSIGARYAQSAGANISYNPADGIINFDGSSGISSFNKTFEITGSATVADINIGKVNTNSTANNYVLDLPLNDAFPVGAEFEIYRAGTGLLSVAAPSGVTINSANAGVVNLLNQLCRGVFRRFSQNTWGYTEYLLDQPISIFTPNSPTVAPFRIINKANTSGTADFRITTNLDVATPGLESASWTIAKLKNGSATSFLNYDSTTDRGTFSTTPVTNLFGLQSFFETLVISASANVTAANIGRLNVNNSASNYALTLPLNDTFNTGSSFEMLRAGTGTFTLVAASGVSINGINGGSFALPDQHDRLVVTRLAQNSWSYVEYSGGLPDTTTLNSAYNAGNTIPFTTGRPIDITLPDDVTNRFLTRNSLNGANGNIISSDLWRGKDQAGTDFSYGQLDLTYRQDLSGGNIQSSQMDILVAQNGVLSSYVSIDGGTQTLTSNRAHSSYSPKVAITASRNVLSSDLGKTLTNAGAGASSVVITYAPSSFDLNGGFDIIRTDSGDLTFAGSGGVIVNGVTNGTFSFSGRYDRASVKIISSNIITIASYDSAGATTRDVEVIGTTIIPTTGYPDGVWTSVISTINGTKTIAANTLQIGQTVEMNMTGLINSVTSGGDATLRVLFGGAVLATSQTVSTSQTGVKNWNLVYKLTRRDSGNFTASTFGMYNDYNNNSHILRLAITPTVIAGAFASDNVIDVQCLSEPTGGSTFEFIASNLNIIKYT